MRNYWSSAFSEALRETRRVWKAPDGADLWKLFGVPVVAGGIIYLITGDVAAVTLATIIVLLLSIGVTFGWQIFRVPPRRAEDAAAAHRKAMAEEEANRRVLEQNQTIFAHIAEDHRKTQDALLIQAGQREAEWREKYEDLLVKVSGRDPTSAVQHGVLVGVAEGLALDVDGRAGTIPSLTTDRLFKPDEMFRLGGWEMRIVGHGQVQPNKDDPTSAVYHEVACELLHPVLGARPRA